MSARDRQREFEGNTNVIPLPERADSSNQETLDAAQARAHDFACEQSRLPLEANGPHRAPWDGVVIPVLDVREVPLEVAIFLAPPESAEVSVTTRPSTSVTPTVEEN